MRLLIIGNGVSGTTTARLVATQVPDVEITLCTDEPYLYYPRPRLIDLLAGKNTAQDIISYAPEWYAERGLRVWANKPIAEIHPAKHQAVCGDGDVLDYDKLVLATGARCWVPPIPGSDLDAVSTLRTLDDALKLRDRATQCRHATILGGGLLGLDTSMGLSAHQTQITVVEMMPRLLPRQLDAEGATLLVKLLERKGIQVITGDMCTLIEQNGSDLKLNLKSGKEITTDMVVISAGIRSNIDLAQNAGIACNHGIIVNERMETSAPDVYAVGDAAEFNERVWGIIPAALAQAKIAADQIAGQTESVYTDIVPSTTLQVAGIEVTSVGVINSTDEQATEIRHTDEQAGVYKKLTIREASISGAIFIGDRKSMRIVGQLMRQGTRITGDVNRLLDDDFDLRSVLQ